MTTTQLRLCPVCRANGLARFGSPGTRFGTCREDDKRLEVMEQLGDEDYTGMTEDDIAALIRPEDEEDDAREDNEDLAPVVDLMAYRRTGGAIAHHPSGQLPSSLLYAKLVASGELTPEELDEKLLELCEAVDSETDEDREDYQERLRDVAAEWHRLRETDEEAALPLVEEVLDDDAELADDEDPDRCGTCGVEL